MLLSARCPRRTRILVLTAVLALLCTQSLSFAQSDGRLSTIDSFSAAAPTQADFDRVLSRLNQAEQRIEQIESRRLPPVEPQFDSDSENAVRELAARVQELEETLQRNAEAEEKEKASAAEKPTQRWTGRIHADYWAFPETSPGANAFETGDQFDSVDDRFLIRRARLGIQGDIPDTMHYKLEVDFNSPSSPQFKDIYFGWNDLPILQTLRFGNQKRPYGLDHLHSSRFTVFIERPAIVEAFNQDSRRFGLASYGVSEDLSRNWCFGAFMSQDWQNIGSIFSTPTTEDYQAEFAGRLANTFWYDEASDGRFYGHWAVAGTIASTDPTGISSSTARFQSRPEARTSSRWIDTGVIFGADSYELFCLEGLLNLGPLQISGEYQHCWMQRPASSELHFDGGYVYVSYFLTGEHMTWQRDSGQADRVHPRENFFRVRTSDGQIGSAWGAWQVGVRYSVADLNDDNVLGGQSDVVTLAVNWHWTPYSKMQLDYMLGTIDNRSPVDGQSAGDFQIVGARFMVDF